MYHGHYEQELARLFVGFLIFLCLPIPDTMRREEPDQVR